MTIDIDKSMLDDTNEVILVKPSRTVPANSFAMITGYDKNNRYFDVDRPDEDDIAMGKTVIVPEEIKSGDIGIAFAEGIHIVKKAGGEDWADTEFCGPKEDSFEAKAGGGFMILQDMGNNYILVRQSTAPGTIRLAFMKNDPQTSYRGVSPNYTNVAECYLDVNLTGEVIDVNFRTFSGATVATGIPILEQGTQIQVTQIEGVWWCVWWLYGYATCDVEFT